MRKAVKRESKVQTGGRPVVVTTAHKGVFFGYLTSQDGDVVELRRGRNAVYWSADLRGFVGLAVAGPSSACKIGPAADMQVRDVTAVVECSSEAAGKWELAPWSN